MYNYIRVRVILQTYDEKSYAPIGRYPILKRHSSARGRSEATPWGNYLKSKLTLTLLCTGKSLTNISRFILTHNPNRQFDQKNLWFVIPLFPMFVIFFISALAETNRPPFDLPEAEAELVAGYQTEYSGMMYAMFWLGEYANILLMCAMGAILFLGGWLSPIDMYPFTLVPGAIWLILKILLLFILFALVKAIVPRYRYDQLMRLGWKVFLPLSLTWVILTASYLFYFNLLPVN